MTELYSGQLKQTSVNYSVSPISGFVGLPTWFNRSFLYPPERERDLKTHTHTE